MAHGIEALPLLEQLLRVERRVEDALRLPQGACQEGAVGTDDGAAAPADPPEPRQLLREREVGRVARGLLEVAGADHIGARLERDVHEGRLPAFAVVGRRGDVDLDARLVEREPRERHVVLPADEAAEPPERRLDRPQAAAVSLAPDEALVVRRHQLAMLEGELAVRAVVEERVVERPGAVTLDLVHADDEPDAVRAGDLGQALAPGAGNLDRLAGQHGERRLASFVSPAGEELRPRRRRIRGHEHFREDDELGAGAGGLADQSLELVERRGLIEHDGLDLDARNVDRLTHEPNSAASILARALTTIFVDYDGTITEQDLLDTIAQTFGDPEVYAEVDRGLDENRLTLHEVLRREFEPVRAPLPEVVGWVLEHAVIRPGFHDLVALARERGWRLVVLSSGFRELIQPVLEREGLGEVELLANSIEPDPEGWRASFRDEQSCPVCGEPCKRAAVVAESNGGERVYVGDGISDRCGAEASDLVFARRGLASYLRDRGVQFEHFDDFHEIVATLRMQDR